MLDISENDGQNLLDEQFDLIGNLLTFLHCTNLQLKMTQMRAQTSI